MDEVDTEQFHLSCLRKRKAGSGSVHKTTLHSKIYQRCGKGGIQVFTLPDVSHMEDFSDDEGVREAILWKI